MVKKILVALDGSEASKNALNFGLDLADRLSASIELLTVVPPIFLPSYSIYVLKSDALCECAKNLANLLKFCRLIVKNSAFVAKSQMELMNCAIVYIIS